MPSIRSCVVCVDKDQLLAIELQDPATGHKFWSLPGGRVEPGESPQESGVRETLEETGYTVTLTSHAYINEYMFRWDASDFHCRTHWFSANLAQIDPVPVNDATYILQTKWLALPDSRQMFDYHPAIVAALNRLLPK